MDDLDPTPSDLEQVVDAARKDVGLGPAPRSPEQGIADMDARIAELRRLKNDLLDVQAPDGEIIAVNRQLADAHRRRGEYQAQLKGRN